MGVAEARRPRQGVVRVYDFRRPDRFSKEQLRALYMIHENVARGLGTALSAFYRGLTTVSVGEVTQQTYAQFIDALPNPGIVAVVALPPLEGRALLELDPQLAFPVLDRMFGGPGEALPDVRALTDIEQMVIRRVFDAMARGIGEAWSQLAAVTPAVELIETNPTFLQLAAPGEAVLAVELIAQMGPHMGRLRLCMPLLLLEPVLPRLSADQWFNPKQRTARPADVEAHLRRVQVTITALLGRARLRLGELLQLERGDVIQLDRRRDDPLEVLVEERPKLWAQPGTLRGRMAVRVLGPVESPEGGEVDVGA